MDKLDLESINVKKLLEMVNSAYNNSNNDLKLKYRLNTQFSLNFCEDLLKMKNYEKYRSQLVDLSNKLIEIEKNYNELKKKKFFITKNEASDLREKLRSTTELLNSIIDSIKNNEDIFKKLAKDTFLEVIKKVKESFEFNEEKIKDEYNKKIEGGTDFLDNESSKQANKKDAENLTKKIYNLFEKLEAFEENAKKDHFKLEDFSKFISESKVFIPNINEFQYLNPRWFQEILDSEVVNINTCIRTFESLLNSAKNSAKNSVKNSVKNDEFSDWEIIDSEKSETNNSKKNETSIYNKDNLNHKSKILKSKTSDNLNHKSKIQKSKILSKDEKTFWVKLPSFRRKK